MARWKRLPAIAGNLEKKEFVNYWTLNKLSDMFQFEVFELKKYWGVLELNLKGEPILTMVSCLCILVFMLVKTFVIFGGS